jgi:hypothetical protein
LANLSIELFENKKESKADSERFKEEIQTQLDRFGRGLAAKGIEKIEGIDPGETLIEALSRTFAAIRESDLEPPVPDLDPEESLALFSAVATVSSWISENFIPQNKIDSERWFESLFLDRRIQKVLAERGLPSGQAWRWTQILLLLGFSEDEKSSREEAFPLLRFVKSERGRNLIQVHDYDSKSWFREEAFGDFVWWISYWSCLKDAHNGRDFQEKWEMSEKTLQSWMESAQVSDYRYDRLLKVLQQEANPLTRIQSEPIADSESPDETPNSH